MSRQAARDERKEIIKRLEKATAIGWRANQIFEDWLELVEACLVELPRHTMAAHLGQPLTDSPETVKIFKRIRERYSRYERESYYFDLFSESLGILMDSAWEYQDVIGDVYMRFAYPNPGTGQYFTPFPVCQMMAEMTVGDGPGEVHRRIRDALAGDPLGQAVLMASLVIEDKDEAWQWFVERVLPAAMLAYQPLTIADPACGSGAMLLAAAQRFPRWMVHYGLVQFFGQDVDITCVRMARCNMMLYGLNRWGLRYALAARGVDSETPESEMPAEPDYCLHLPVMAGAEVGA